MCKIRIKFWESFFLIVVHLTITTSACYAYKVEINGINYDLVASTNTAKVIKRADLYSGEIIIPNEVEYKGRSFSVTSLGDSVFFNCNSLISLTIPCSVNTIGNYCFSDCTSLKKLIFQDGSDTRLEISGTSKFDDCPLKEIYIGRTFYANSHYNCSNYISGKEIESLTISPKVSDISDPYDEFMGSNKIKNFYIENFNYSWDHEIINPENIYYKGKLIEGDYEIPEEITKWSDYSFYSYEKITSINGGKNLIDLSCFNDFINSIEVSSTVKNFTCSTCKKLKNISILTSSAALDMRDVTSNKTGKHKSYLEDSPLEYVYIDRDIHYYDYFVMLIAGESFHYPLFNGQNLKELIIGPHVTKIPQNLFNSVNSIESLIVNNVDPIPFVSPGKKYYGGMYFKDDIYWNTVLIVPKGCKEKYANADVWKYFIEIREDESLSEISNKTVNNKHVERIFSLDGKKLSKPQCGLNIIRTSDGTIKKVLVK